MSHYVANFLSGPGQLVALAAVAAVWTGLGALGAALVGRDRIAEADFVSGWAVAVLLFTALGVLTPIPFTWIAVGLGVAAVTAVRFAWRRDGRLVPAPALRMALLALPLLVLVSAMAASQWDEFSHWLLASRFLLQTDGFPSAARPGTELSYTAYPFAWPLITYLASRLAGYLLESAAPLVNVLLLLSFGLLVLRLIRRAARTPEQTPWGWGLCALGVLAVTLFNPTFVQKVILTAYADTSSAVSLGFATVLAWLAVEERAAGDAGTARRLAWQAGLALVVLVSLKQATLVLFALAVGAAGVLVVRDSRVRLADGLRLLVRMAVPPLVVYALWRYHVATQLSGGEFSIRSISAWSFDLLPTILAAMASVAAKKSLYFGIMIVAVAMGVRGIVRMKTPLDRLAVMCATLFLGYNGFLLFAYVAAFSPFDAARVASFWRYNMHLGAVAIAFAGFGLARAWAERLAGRFDPRLLGRIAVVLVLAAPFAFAGKLRFDRNPPAPYFRVVGAEAVALLPDGVKYLVVDPQGSGQSAMITRYESGGRTHLVGFVSAFTNPTADNIREVVETRRPDYVLVFSVTPAVDAALGVDLAAGRVYLLGRTDGGWTPRHTWPRGDAG